MSDNNGLLDRLAALQHETPALRLFALVDGVHYREHVGTAIAPHRGFASLFAGTPDSGLAHAGPWLIDVEEAGGDVCQVLASLESARPALIWLFATQTLAGLAQLLQLKLDVELPDGRKALLRFWDPRVLLDLSDLLNQRQREEFFGYIHEWHLLQQGKRVWIGRPRVNFE